MATTSTPADDAVPTEPPAPLSHWRRIPADPVDWFDRDEIERGRAYNRPLERLKRVRMAVGFAVAVAFIVSEAGPRLIDALDLEGWILQLTAVAVAFTLTDLVYGPWFDAYQQLVYEKRWDMSTQTVKGFVADTVKGTVLGVVVTLILVIPLYAVIRSTELWWLWGWLLFSGFTVLLGLLFPIVIAPIFNKFTPLDDDELRSRLLATAERLGLDVSEVLVADASRRSRAGNAYVAGLGSTRRVVLFDTILDWPHEVIEQVVAHELGHWRFSHTRRKVVVLSAVQLVMFLATWVILQWDWLLELGGVETVSDPGSLPIFMTVFPAGFVAVNLASSWLSRADERQADIYALDNLGDPAAFSQVFKRLAETNKADVDPSWWKRLNASHPPVAERLAMAQQWQQQRQAVAGAG